MKNPKILYILITVFCVFALIAGIYAQFISPDRGGTNTNKGKDENVTLPKDVETIKAEFNDLFTNTVNLNGYDTTGISKIKTEEEIVYTAYNINKATDAFEIHIRIPVVNIKTEVANSFNSVTQALFANKASEILGKTDTASKTIYSIDYVSYVNGDILSVVIKSTLKEGDNAQRVMIQTYNYNLTNHTKATLTDLITAKGLNKEDVNRQIKTVVKEADDASKAVQNMGYNDIYVRDLTNQMYAVDNASTYFLGLNQELYIIYAYGNQNYTSEMDIVLLE